jgi:hypothetical protein
MKMTLRRKAERPKPMDVPITPLTSCSAKKMTSPRPTPPRTSAKIISMFTTVVAPLLS